MVIKCEYFHDDEQGHFRNAEYVFETDLDKLNKFIQKSNLDKSDVINIIEERNEMGKPCLRLYYWSKEIE